MVDQVSFISHQPTVPVEVTIQLGLQASNLSENRNTRNKYSKASQEKNIFMYL